eukprot:3529971-Pyramimonas_sp.AAC.1
MCDDVASDMGASIAWWDTLASYLVELQRCGGVGPGGLGLLSCCNAMGGFTPSGGVVKTNGTQKRKWPSDLEGGRQPELRAGPEARSCSPN